MTDIKRFGKNLWTWVVPAADASPAQVNAARASDHVVELPYERMSAASVWYILDEGYGLGRSIRERVPVDASGEPLPHYTYSAIHYLDALDWGDRDIFEFGAGFSTLWWARRARTVTSTENNPQWHAELLPRVPENAKVILETAADPASVIHRFPGPYDAIVVDCAGNRYDAAQAAIRYLRPGGVIVLDNTEWYPKTTQSLRSADLIQIDFSGFKPSKSYASVTSLFIHPEFRTRPKSGRLPQCPIGGKDRFRDRPHSWDSPSEQ